MILLFLKVFNMSIAAGWLILAVIVLRFLLKRAPKWLHCVLWALVAVRLLCPVSMESALSLIPNRTPLPLETVQYAAHPTVNSGIPIVDALINPVIGETFAASPEVSVNPLYVWTYLAGILWVIGIAVLLAYTAIRYFRLCRVVRESAPLRNNIYFCDHIQTPFILGLFRPRVYLPSDLRDEQIQIVIAHEKAHLIRCDHWWKALGWLLLSVYWFHPLCWIAYILFCRDMELACDEKVIRNMDENDRKAYAQALLSCSMPRRFVSACPLAFGEISIKKRIKSVLYYKKPAFWIIALAVIACVITAVCFLTNPKSEVPYTASQAEPLELMGLSCWYVDEEMMPHFITRTYYTQNTDKNADAVIIAESFGFEINDYIIDLDGDGLTELVCNCQYGGDGHESVYVYRRNGNLIEQGYLDLEHKQLDMVMPADWKNWGINSTAERYHADSGMFEVRYDTDHGQELATVSHLSHFTFEEYARLP